MYFLLNLRHYVKSCGHFCQILALFMMPAHQIWSYHVTQKANFENLLFCPNSTFNIRKSHKISSGKALYFRSYQPKNVTWVENNPPPSPVPLGLILKVNKFQLPPPKRLSTVVKNILGGHHVPPPAQC